MATAKSTRLILYDITTTLPTKIVATCHKNEMQAMISLQGMAKEGLELYCNLILSDQRFFQIYCFSSSIVLRCIVFGNILAVLGYFTGL